MKKLNLTAVIVTVVCLSMVPLVGSVHSETSWEPVGEAISISTVAAGSCDTSCKNLFPPHWLCLQYSEPVNLICVDRGDHCSTEQCNFCIYPCN